jgi:predicted aspartyl protease
MNTQLGGNAMNCRSFFVFVFSLGFFAADLISADVAQEVSFRLRQGKIVVQGSIGKLRGCQFIVDTGASLTVVSPEVARKLALKEERAASTFIHGQIAKLPEAHLPELSLGPVLFESVPVLIADLRLHFGFRVDALIGLELLRRKPLSIDFVHQEITFAPVHHPESALRFYSEAPSIYLPVTADNGSNLHLVLDTGTAMLVLYPERVGDQILIHRKGKRESFLVAGQSLIHLEQVSLARLAIGATEWKNLPAHLQENTGDGRPHVYGIVGPLALGLKTLNLDFERSLISWTR